MSYVLNLLPGLIVGSMIATLYWQRKIIHRWRMALRRETVLWDTVNAFTQRDHHWLQTQDIETFNEDNALIARALIAISDEMHNQVRHNDDRWPRVPYPDKPWRDFEPAPLLSEGEEAA